MTLRLGLIGDPVAHSVSPVFQQAALDALGLDARYEAWQTPAAALAGRVTSLRHPDALGANVTVPHKQAVIPLLDAVDEAAGHAGAVNTIVNREGRLTGYNTDIEGFLSALRLDGGFEPKGATVAVLGAGGAARAIVWGLVQAGASRVLVLNRTVARAEALVSAMPDGKTAAAPLAGDGEALSKLLTPIDLLVNCTTAGMLHAAGEGMLPLAAGLLQPAWFVVDIVANPAVTPLLRAAAERGCRTLGGLSMLVRQGARSLELWTGRPAPFAIMLDAARRAMYEPA